MSGARAWLPLLLDALQREPAVVRIVLAEVRGSAPREPGTVMVVGRDAIEGTIGGGQLEWDAVAAARALLDEAVTGATGAGAGAGPVTGDGALTAAGVRLDRIVLGADAGQCCGGVVGVWLERYTLAHVATLRAAEQAARCGRAVLVSHFQESTRAHRLVREPGGDAAADRLLRAARPPAPYVRRDPAGGATLFERVDDALPRLVLFGAGHVGRAVAHVVAGLPWQLTWVDSRAGVFPARAPAPAPALVRMLHADDPVATLSDMPAGGYFLVMTHSHPLDYALCRAILRRNDFAWVGLIGSMSKAARFRSRLAREGLAAAVIARLVCPIGIGGITSKWPAAIAVGVAAQLLREVSEAAEDAEFPARAATEPEAACAPGACATCGPAAAPREPAVST
jgi:xanthine dehydrogenase accessory factor